MTFQVTPDDLTNLLGSTVDPVRAWTLLGLAQQLCETIVSPLPDNATAVVLDVAARAYANPTAVPSQVTGPFSVGGAAGGIWLTRQNKATLRRLAGGGGAFTFDTMPATAGSGLPWWDNASIQGDGFEDPGDWDWVS